ncbi:isochorismatase family cysteine hydrolase [Nocardia sp. AG03]|uniref:isochorismatase family cysteine hydrolase n=1 Tax=Nocardia sp. AG03 TaxID=3025312 RepID=UPI0024189E82|nr:isochorismatase family cysteine hydrolase [Nocardia sp. AG03]
MVEDVVASHDWRIDEREYARHEGRRGRRFAYPWIVGARTALVVVDMVPFFVEANAYCRVIVPRVNRLAEVVRAVGGAVAWVLPGGGEPTAAAIEFFGARVAESYSRTGGSGELRDRVYSGLATDADDLYVEKSAPSAFFPGRCPLPGLLERRGVDTVLITGTVTNVCCESSARDAATLGFRTIMVADGNATRTDREHNATLHTIYRSFGDVRPTADLIEMLTTTQ